MRKSTMALLIVAGLGASAAAARSGAQDGLQDSARTPDSLDMPAYETPARKWRVLEDGVRPGSEHCAQTIEQAHAEAGKPEVERKLADPEAPLLIAAVDQRIAGCSVLVMRHDTSDVRPIPAPAGKAVKLQPVE